MTLPLLTVIPAGAGSGKTWQLQKTLGQWIERDLVRPEGIVAVTFTEAAAAELRSRIRQELVGQGRLDAALRLDRAYISTIHSFGRRLLREFAFEAGATPDPQLLEEPEAQVLIAGCLARTSAADEVIDDLARYGYRYDGGTQTSGEAGFRKEILEVIRLLRSIGREGADPALVTACREVISRIYGEAGDGAAMEAELRAAAAAVLLEFPASLAGLFPGNRSATNELRRDHRNLTRAAETDAPARDWRLWTKLREMRLTKRGAPLPAGYDELAERVTGAAEAVLRHPGPLEDALRKAEALLGASADTLSRYGELKRESGLVDYTDMVAGGFAVLGRPEVLESFRTRVDCVVIDEFQDTNPLQFSLLWALSEAGVPTLVVGDVKQSIMRFQGADPRLLTALAGNHPEAVWPLRENWRSSRELMPFLNCIGAHLFPEDYLSLEPKAPFTSRLAPLEVIVSTEGMRKAQAELRAGVARRVGELLESGTEVYDRHLDGYRSLRGEDIAILCRTHAQIARYAEELRAFGIRPRVARKGFCSTRVVQLTCHALAFAGVREDRHAGLYLAVTELGQDSLENALRRLLDGEKPEDGVLVSLRALRDSPDDEHLDALLDHVVRALDLWDLIARWPDAEQARANLLRLRAEVRRFLDQTAEARACSGIHGTGVPSFLAWLARIDGTDDDVQPDPRVRDEDGVSVVTWNKAKGLEWPVVFVCTLDSDVGPRLPTLRSRFESFDDLGNILDLSRIEILPDFDVKEISDRFKAELASDEDESARCLLYVALTRAREMLILEWPRYAQAAKYRKFLTHLRSSGLELQEKILTIEGEEFPCRVIQAEPAGEGERQGAGRPATLPRLGRRALSGRETRLAPTPEKITPSEVSAAPTRELDPRHETYGRPLEVEIPLAEHARGTFLHRCLEVLLTDPDQLPRLRDAVVVEIDDRGWREIAAAAAAFRDWLEKTLSPTRLETEVPILYLDEQGSVVTGTADLVVETADGLWVFDHKSEEPDDPRSAFRSYQRQLELYAEGFDRGSDGVRVAGVGINWVRSGTVTMAAWGASPGTTEGWSMQ